MIWKIVGFNDQKKVHKDDIQLTWCELFETFFH